MVRAGVRNGSARRHDFDHERLDVYRAALEFASWRRGLVRRIPRGNADLVDQITRASRSVTLNIAEGSGENSPADKVRFFRMARRSATECAAALDLMAIERMVAEDALLSGRELLWRIVSMLTKLIASRQPPDA